MKQTRYCLRSPPSDVARTTDCLAMSLAEGVEVVEITRRPSVDDPVDDVEHNERQRKTFPRQFVDAPRSTFACVHVDRRPRRNYDRRTATSSRRLAVRSTDTGRSQLYTNTPCVRLHTVRRLGLTATYCCITGYQLVISVMLIRRVSSLTECLTLSLIRVGHCAYIRNVYRPQNPHCPRLE